MRRSWPRSARPRAGSAATRSPRWCTRWRSSTRQASVPRRRTSSAAGSSRPAPRGSALTLPPMRWPSAWTPAARPAWPRSPGCSAPARKTPAASSARWYSTTRSPASWSPPPSTCPARSASSCEQARAAAADDPRFAVNAAELRKVIPADLTPGEIDARHGRGVDRCLLYPAVPARAPGRPQPPGRAPRRADLGGERHQAAASWPPQPGAPAATPPRSWPRPSLSSAASPSMTRCRPTAGNAPSSTRTRPWPRRRRPRRWASGSPNGPGRTRPARPRWPASTTTGSTAWSCATTTAPTRPMPGLALTFRPRPHQVAAVARMVHEPAVLLAHEVGAGKTAEMIIGVTELRRLGLARKPAVVVPNHMLEQFAREWLQLYPQCPRPGRPPRGPAGRAAPRGSSPAAPPATGTGSSCPGRRSSGSRCPPASSRRTWSASST